jgi:hypothetical protein
MIHVRVETAKGEEGTKGQASFHPGTKAYLKFHSEAAVP